MHNNHLKFITFAITSFILDFEGEVLKKIANIRMYYTKELQKEKEKSGRGVDHMCDSKQSHYYSITFLHDHIVPKKTKSDFVGIFFAKTF